MCPPMTHWKSVNDHISKEFGGCTHVSQVFMDVDMDIRAHNLCHDNRQLIVIAINRNHSASKINCN